MTDKQQKRKETCYSIALQMASQAWCSEKNKHKTMDYELAKEFARLAASWIEDAAQHLDNKEYYRSLLVQCGEYIGEDAYTQDDGNVVPDVLCAKIPELVKDLVDKMSRL